MKCNNWCGAVIRTFYRKMKENYAFSIERKIDWEGVNNEYRKTITRETTSEQLFKVLGNIVTLFCKVCLVNPLAIFILLPPIKGL
jgi:hypothetical protein